MNALMDRVDELEEGTPRQLDRLRDEITSHVGSELDAALTEYRALRIAGTFALGIGLICTTVANFV